MERALIRLRTVPSRWKLHSLVNHNLVVSGVIVLFGSTLVNFLNYLFTIIMGRFLTPEQFGTVTTLLGLFIVAVVPASTLTTLSAKYMGQFYGQKQLSHARDFLTVMRAKCIWFSLALFFLFLLAIPWLSTFLHIEPIAFVIFSLILPISLLGALYNGALQGLHAFKSYAQMNVLGTVGKLIFCVGFVMLGLSVRGVLLGLLFAMIVSLLYGMWRVKYFFNHHRDSNHPPSEVYLSWYVISSSARAIFMAMLLNALLANGDIILAKHYFTPDIAGQYAALSVVSKTILYGSPAFTAVLLPMVSARVHTHSRASQELLHMSLLAVTLIGCSLLLLFLFFPYQAMHFLIGDQYLSLVHYIPYLGGAMVCSAVASVFTNYYIALHEYVFLRILGLSVGILYLGIIFSRHTLSHIITATVVANVVLLIGLVGYYIVSLQRKKHG